MGRTVLTKSGRTFDRSGNQVFEVLNGVTQTTRITDPSILDAIGGPNLVALAGQDAKKFSQSILDSPPAGKQFAPAPSSAKRQTATGFSPTGFNIPEGIDLSFLSPKQRKTLGAPKPRPIDTLGTPVSAPRAGAQITPPTPTAPDLLTNFTLATQTSTEQSRKDLQNIYNTQILNLGSEIQELNQTIADSEDRIGDVLLSQRREEIQAKERQKFKVEENFFANQRSLSELETIMTAANTEILQAKAVTGLASIRNPRIAKITEEAIARVGVIQAVMAARNNQISVAENLINNTLRVVEASMNDELAYYGMIRDSADKRLITLKRDEKNFIQAQIGRIETNLKEAEEVADFIGGLMFDPKSAQMAEDAGLSLNMSKEQLGGALSKWNYRQEVTAQRNELELDGFEELSSAEAARKPEGELTRQTDTRGVERIYWKKGGATGDVDVDIPTFDQFLDEFMSETEDAGVVAKREEIIRLIQEEFQASVAPEELKRLVGEQILDFYEEEVEQLTAKGEFTNTQLLKLEGAGLLGKPKSEQLKFLFSDEEEGGGGREP